MLVCSYTVHLFIIEIKFKCETGQNKNKNKDNKYEDNNGIRH